MKRLLLMLLSAVLVVGIGVVWYSLEPLAIHEPTDVFIPRGASPQKAAQAVAHARMVRMPNLFSFLLRLACKFSGGVIYSGSYRFTADNNHLQLFRALLSGKQALKVRVTYPEGISAVRFASISQKQIGLDSAAFMSCVHQDSLCTTLGVDAHSLEGYMMPDTYEFYWKEPVEDVVGTLVRHQNKIWQEKFEKQALDQGKSRLEVLTLASIIEAETPSADERSRIAGVYVNRLEKGMRLEADPTVQYAIGGDSRRLYYTDLDVESPYNTYRHTGLPPGPINSPSTESIMAALNPESHSYIFFCAKGDGSRSHSFARTSEEHRVNVLRYRKNRRLAEKD